MTAAIFANDTLTLLKSGVSFSINLGESEAEELRDQLLERYPVEPEATPVVGPLHKVAEAEQAATPKQDSRSEIDTSEYPFIRLEAIKAADLVDLICDAYQKGKTAESANGEDSNER